MISLFFYKAFSENMWVCLLFFSFYFFFEALRCYFFFFFFFCENLWPMGFVCNLLGTWACRGLASVTIFFFLDFSSNLFFWAFFFFGVVAESRKNNFKKKYFRVFLIL